MARPVHFEIHATDPEELIAFYRDVFDWRFERWGDQDYWNADTGEGQGINGAVTRRRGPAPDAGAPVMGATLVLYVEDIDATVERALAKGATVALEKMAIPGVGCAAYLHDPDRNVIGLFVRDEEAT